MGLSVEQLAELIQTNRALVETVRQAIASGAAVTDAVAAELAARRRKTAAALAIEAGRGIAVELSATMEDQQKDQLGRIASLEQQVADLAAEPELQAAVLVDLSSAYLSLSNTYSRGVERIVPLTTEDRATIAGLIHQAELDTEQRRRWDAILGGAVALLKAALKVSVAVAAA